MKKLSGTFTLVALAAIAIGSILTFRLFAQSPTPTPSGPKYTLLISNKTSVTDSLPVQDVEKFKTLLRSPGMISDVGYQNQPGTGVNVTQKVTSDNATDFQKVLNSFQAPPTPSPTAKPTVTP